MYKYLIVGVTFLVLGGAGYYFNSSGGGDLIVQAIATTDGQNYGVSGVEVFSGKYECGTSDGCSSTTYFVLNGDTTLEITSVKEGEDDEQTIGTGTWGVGSGGALVFIIDPVTTAPTRSGFSFVAKKIDSLTISGFSNKVSSYEGLKDPTFTRISNQ